MIALLPFILFAACIVAHTLQFNDTITYFFKDTYTFIHGANKDRCVALAYFLPFTRITRSESVLSYSEVKTKEVVSLYPCSYSAVYHHVVVHDI